MKEMFLEHDRNLNFSQFSTTTYVNAFWYIINKKLIN